MGGMVMRVGAGLATLALAGMLAGCNTVHGMGKDITRAGEAISSAAR